MISKNYKLTILMCLLAVSFALEVIAPGTQAAEISADFTLDLSAEPELVTAQASKFGLDIEGITNLSFTFGGLKLSNTTILGMGGLSFSAFTLETTLGALEFADHFIFAPNIIEADDDPFMTVVSVNPDPGHIVGLPLIFWANDLDLASPIDLARILGRTLTEDITFQKKIVRIGTHLAGISFDLDFLLANLGTAQAPDFKMGIIPRVSGEMLNGSTYTASTYIGARDGMECFGVCKPEERFYRGRLADDLTLKEEEIIIEDLIIGGIENDLQLTFELQTPESLPEMRIDTKFPIGEFQIEHRASFESIANFQPDKSIISGSFKAGGLNIKATFLDRIGDFVYPIRQLETSFDFQGLEIEGIIFINTDIGGSLYLVETSIPIGRSLDFKSQVVYLGGELYSFNFGIEHHMNNLILQGTTKFRPGYLLVSDFAISVSF